MNTNDVLLVGGKNLGALSSTTLTDKPQEMLLATARYMEMKDVLLNLPLI
jgi:hypothetical protein